VCCIFQVHLAKGHTSLSISQVSGEPLWAAAATLKTLHLTTGAYGEVQTDPPQALSTEVNEYRGIFTCWPALDH
jgi:hypothetical protein